MQAAGNLNPMFECNQQQDAHELLVTVLNTLKDIKIPVPVIRTIATNDVIDSVSTVKSHCEAENHNGEKKGNRKLESHCNSSNSSSSGSHMSN